MNTPRAVTAFVQTLMLEPNDWVPNNPHLPVIIYPKAIAIQDSDPAGLFEKTFNDNGWPPQWRYGVYNYHHYHTEGHEVLGVFSGQARLMLGGQTDIFLRSVQAMYCCCLLALAIAI